MKIRGILLGIGIVGTAALGLALPAIAGEGALRLTASQKEFLRLEPILVTLHVTGPTDGLPPAPFESAADRLRFEIEPAVKPRPGAKPLPEEARRGDKEKARNYDLLEWFEFPDKGGTWTVRAVFEEGGLRLASKPVTLTLRTPAKADTDFAAMTRIHHIPWSNYETNAYCGDTFDVVLKWPESRYAKYCHYYSGLNSQNKKEYAKAIESYRTVLAKYPDFALAEDAKRGLLECLQAQESSKSEPKK